MSRENISQTEQNMNNDSRISNPETEGKALQNPSEESNEEYEFPGELRLRLANEALIKALDVKDAAFISKKLLCERQQKRITTLVHELTDKTARLENLEETYKAQIDEMQQKNASTVASLQLELRTLSTICHKWETKQKDKELVLIGRLKEEQAQWEEEEMNYRKAIQADKISSIFEQIIQGSEKFVDNTSKSIVNQGECIPFALPGEDFRNLEQDEMRGQSESKLKELKLKLIKKINKELQNKLVSKQPQNIESEQDRLARLVCEIEDWFFNEIRRVRERGIGQVIALEIKHRYDLRNMEDWYEQRTGFKRMEAALNDKLNQAKQRFEDEIINIKQKHAVEVENFNAEKEEFAQISEAKLELEKRKAQTELMKQKMHYDISVISPLEQQLRNITNESTRAKQTYESKIVSLEEDIKNQIESSSSILESTKRSLNLQLAAKNKIIESMNDAIQQRDSEIVRLKNEIKSLEKQATQLHQETNQFNDLIVQNDIKKNEEIQMILLACKEEQAMRISEALSEQAEYYLDLISSLQSQHLQFLSIEQQSKADLNDQYNELLESCSNYFTQLNSQSILVQNLKELNVCTYDEFKFFIREIINYSKSLTSNQQLSNPSHLRNFSPMTTTASTAAAAAIAATTAQNNGIIINEESILSDPELQSILPQKLEQIEIAQQIIKHIGTSNLQDLEKLQLELTNSLANQSKFKKDSKEEQTAADNLALHKQCRSFGLSTSRRLNNSSRMSSSQKNYSKDRFELQHKRALLNASTSVFKGDMPSSNISIINISSDSLAPLDQQLNSSYTLGAPTHTSLSKNQNSTNLHNMRCLTSAGASDDRSIRIDCDILTKIRSQTPISKAESVIRLLDSAKNSKKHRKFLGKPERNSSKKFEKLYGDFGVIMNNPNTSDFADTTTASSQNTKSSFLKHATHTQDSNFRSPSLNQLQPDIIGDSFSLLVNPGFSNKILSDDTDPASETYPKQFRRMKLSSSSVSRKTSKNISIQEPGIQPSEPKMVKPSYGQVYSQIFSKPRTHRTQINVDEPLLKFNQSLANQPLPQQLQNIQK